MVSTRLKTYTMAKYGLNRVTLIGNLGQDPEIRYTDQGVAYTQISLACTEASRDKEGNYIDRTEWVRVTLWRGQADIAAKYLRKGSTVYIDGRLRTSSWETPQGEKRSRTDVEGTRLILLDSRNPQAGAPIGQPPMQTPQPQRPVNSVPSSPAGTPSKPTISEGDDDLPF